MYIRNRDLKISCQPLRREWRLVFLYFLFFFPKWYCLDYRYQFVFVDVDQGLLTTTLIRSVRKLAIHTYISIKNSWKRS